MAVEKVNRDELNKLLRQRRLRASNAKKEKEIFPLVDYIVGRERNEDSEIDCESLLETFLDTDKEAMDLRDKIQNLLINEKHTEHLRQIEFNISLEKKKTEVIKIS